jgi:hypothetical protein
MYVIITISKFSMSIKTLLTLVRSHEQTTLIPPKAKVKKIKLTFVLLVNEAKLGMLKNLPF